MQTSTAIAAPLLAAGLVESVSTRLREDEDAPQRPPVASSPYTSSQPISARAKFLYLAAFYAASITIWLTLLRRLFHHHLDPTAPAHHALTTLAHAAQIPGMLELLHPFLRLSRKPLLPLPERVSPPCYSRACWTCHTENLLRRENIGDALRHAATRAWMLSGVCALFSGAGEGGVFEVMLAAWAVAETARCSYQLLRVAGVDGKHIYWIRYGVTGAVYPVAAAAEAWTVWKSLDQAWVMSERYWVFLVVALISYPLGMMGHYDHMNRQQIKHTRGITPEKVAQADAWWMQ